jgi:cytochrome c
MRCPPAELLLVAAIVVSAQQPRYNIGRPAPQAEISRWDLAISPGGNELPPGRGTAAEGARIYSRKCESCHGPAGRGGKFDPLAGGAGTLATAQPVRTVGSYWPYATTLWDYINRATPQGDIGSLNNDEVYALTAYILSLNGIIGADEAMDSRSLPKVRMPNRDGFTSDTRPDWAEPQAGHKKK